MVRKQLSTSQEIIMLFIIEIKTSIHLFEKFNLCILLTVREHCIDIIEPCCVVKCIYPYFEVNKYIPLCFDAQCPNSIKFN
jgi:hypothetical protein